MTVQSSGADTIMFQFCAEQDASCVRGKGCDEGCDLDLHERQAWAMDAAYEAGPQVLPGRSGAVSLPECGCHLCLLQ